MALEVLTPPAAEPVSRAEAKRHLRIEADDAATDADVDALIVAAREKVQEDSQVQLVTATLALYRDRFPSGRTLVFPIAPLQSVASVEYRDPDGDEQTLDAETYHVDTKSKPPRIVLANGETWPAIDSGYPNAVTITFDAGYGDAADVPDFAKHAMKLLMGAWYRNREAEALGTISTELKIGYEALLNSLRWTALPILDDDDV